MAIAGYVGQVHIGQDDYLVGSTLFTVLDTSSNPASGSITETTTNTSNDTVLFSVPLTGFSLAKGVTVHVQFKQENTVTNKILKLKVGNADAKVIKNPNGAKSWKADAVISFTYDGANWVMNSSAVDGSSIQNLSLGNITNEGKLDTASVAVVTDANKKITTENLSVNDPSSGGNSTAFTFIDTISQNGKGKISPTKKTIPMVSSSTAGLVPKGAAVETQSTTTKFLREDGSWAAPSYYTHPTTAGNKHIPSGGSSGQFLKYGGESGTATWASFSNLTLKFDSGTTEGTDLYTYNSNTAKTLDIKHGSSITFTTASGSLTIAHATGDGYHHVPATGANNSGKFLKITGDTAGSIGWAELEKSDLGLGNVTNHAQVTSLQWDTTNKKITYKVSEGTATDLLTFVQGSNITLTAANGQLTIAGTANNAVTQTNTTGNATYDLLFSSSTSTTDTKTEGARKHSGSLTYNPSTGVLTATKFSGDGSGLTNVVASSVAWSNVSGTPTTLSGYGITDALSSSATITIAGNSVSLNGGSLAADTLRTSLGLSKALRFVGTTTSNITDGWTGVPAGITNYTTPVVGDVVIKGGYEYVCVSVSGTTYTWELLGGDSSFALDDAVIHNSLLTATGDIIYRSSSAPTRLGIGTAGQVLTVSGGVPVWADNAATDKKVEQKGITTSGNYPVLLKYDTGTSNVTANYVNFGKTDGKGLTFNPNTGVLTAYEVHGILQASDVKTALGYDSSTASTSLLFLHKSGAWKTLQVTNTTTTVASVSNGVLTLVASVKENAALSITT